MFSSDGKEEAPPNQTAMITANSSSPSSSFRSVYYGVASAGAVPFIWESQPGTPKYTFRHTHHHDTSTMTNIPPPPPPPLTPPPSYFSTSNNRSKSSNYKKSASKKHKILYTIFPKMRITTTTTTTTTHTDQNHYNVPSFSLSSSTATTKSSSSSPTRTSKPLSFYLRSRFSSPRSSFDSRGDDGDVNFGSPTSTLCSVSSSSSSSNSSSVVVVGDKEINADGRLLFRGCYSMVNVKKALLSIIVGSHGGSSAQPSPTASC